MGWYVFFWISPQEIKVMQPILSSLSFSASMSETLFVFRDAVDDFLRRFTGMLRVAVDQEALQRSNNFPVSSCNGFILTYQTMKY